MLVSSALDIELALLPCLRRTRREAYADNYDFSVFATGAIGAVF